MLTLVVVNEMGYNNISIKLLEEKFPQEDSMVKVTLEDLLARCTYIFVYISKMEHIQSDATERLI
jgi:hypothetical protein